VDQADEVTRYLSRNHFDLPVGLDGSGHSARVARQYGVLACPTNYVLDPSGKVVFRCVGFDEAGMRAALRQLGLP